MLSLGYFIDTQICLAALWLLYITLIHRRTHLGISRWYLLLLIPMALLLPALRLPLLPAPDIAAPLPEPAVFTLPVDFHLPVTEELPILPAEARFDPKSLLPGLYWAGVIIVGLITLYKVGRCWRQVNRQKRSGPGEVIFSPQVTSAYSVFGVILINEKYKGSPMLNNILLHEQSHIRRRHTLDLIWISLWQSLLWFNPLLIHIRHLLREVHEFQADADVLAQNEIPEDYIYLLLNTEAGIYPGIATPFCYSLTKKRLEMISRNNRNRGMVRILAVLPLTACLLAAFSLTARAAANPEGDTAPVTELQQTDSAVEVPILSADNQQDNHAAAGVPTDPQSGEQTVRVARYVFITTGEVGTKYREDITEYLDRGWSNTAPGVLQIIQPDGSVTETRVEGTLNMANYQIVQDGQAIAVAPENTELRQQMDEQAARQRERIAEREFAVSSTSGEEPSRTFYEGNRFVFSYTDEQGQIHEEDITQQVIDNGGQWTNPESGTLRIYDTEGNLIASGSSGATVRIGPNARGTDIRPSARRNTTLYRAGGTAISSLDGKIVRVESYSDRTLILINGERITSEAQLKSAIGTFNSGVNVWAGSTEDALEAYGVSGCDGLLVISRDAIRLPAKYNSDNGSGLTGQPITIRGATGLDKENQPIFVIDGELMDQENIYDPQDSRLRTLKSEDYESITVLKGAAAMERYGEAGKNGAIVIVTKKDKYDKALNLRLDI